jgi:serine protease AprX
MESSYMKRLVLAGGATVLLLVTTTDGSTPSAATASVIVQGRSTRELTALVEKAGGKVTHELEIIDAVAANLTPEQYQIVAASPAVRRIDANRVVRAAGPPGAGSLAGIPPAASSPKTGVGTLTGRGVTIAVLDSGIRSWTELLNDTAGSRRLLAQYDAVANSEIASTSNSDDCGHGTHLAAIATSSDRVAYPGIAPDAGLVAVKAFGAAGAGSYSDVIRGLDWIVNNRDRFGIRVVNLSFSARPRSHYWDDPVNRAVMRVWQAGIVVVASAGNTGPGPMSIGVPGNVPYVITVGAMTDAYTPGDATDDKVATFSAAGPTAERFVKPEIVAPGGHVTALMHAATTIARAHREFHTLGRYFTMSGTSQSAAAVTGIVALMLEAAPGLGPDDVKCRLIAGAHPALGADGTLAYPVFQQGAGLVSTYDAVASSASGCANRGLDVQKDLEGTEHYAGPVRQTEDGSYYVDGAAGSPWSASAPWPSGFLWSQSTLWQDSFLWDQSILWWDLDPSNASALEWELPWDDEALEKIAALGSDPIAINTWVEPQ